MRKSERSILIAALLTAGSAANAADQTGPECRGVAAGVVAAMRAAGELASDSEVQAAVVAARRACSAALEDLGGVTPAAAATGTVAAAEEKAEEKSLWDLLTGKQNRKPGNERLRRLKTQ